MPVLTCNLLYCSLGLLAWKGDRPRTRQFPPMSVRDFRAAMNLMQRDTSMEAFVMAAMTKATGADAQRLKDAFPNVYAELYARMHSSGGRLPTDVADKPEADT